MRSIPVIIWGALLVSNAPSAELNNVADAPLRAVQFINENEGWAVGDEGVVWHTLDGGERWDPQTSAVKASLRSVQFLTPTVGWLVGREEQVHGSTGVVLFTANGGLKWERLAASTLPGLNQVKFLSPTTGIAAGDGTDLYPSGVFRTIDGGRTWLPVKGPRTTTWLAADFQDAQTGVLAGAWGRISILRNGVLKSADVDPLGGKDLLGLQLVGQRAVAVGQGGLTLDSRNSAGARWGYFDLRLRRETQSSIDFHAVHVLGNDIWTAGRPGAVVYHSGDSGKSWASHATGQSVPLNGLFFATEKRGWAVGELGTILATGDGGKSWKVQRQGGQRAAVLIVSTTPQRLPIDAAADLGGDQDYLTAGVTVFAPDPATADLAQAHHGARLTAAMRLAGGAAGEAFWQFPLPEHVTDVPADRRMDDSFLRQLALTVRTWRPGVVLTEDALAETVRRAVIKAGDPGAFADQIQTLKLSPWQAVKLYAISGAKAHVSVDLTRISSRLQGTIRDCASEAAEQLSVPALPAIRHYRLVASTLPDASQHKHLMQGSELGGIDRRPVAPAVTLSKDVEKALRLRQTLTVLSETRPTQLADPDRLLGRADLMLKSMPYTMAARATWSLARSYIERGQWDMGRQLLLLLVDRYPRHPLAADALHWLVLDNASSEARRRYELKQFWMASETTFRKSTDAIVQVGAHKMEIPEMVRQTESGLLTGIQETRKWYEGSFDLGKRFLAVNPQQALDPSIQFALQSVRRRLGDFEGATRWCTHFVAEQPDGPWRRAAAAELWLRSPQGQPPKPVVFCRPAASRPYLDADLGDPCWQELPSLKFENASGDTLKEYKTEAWLTYDKDFLYLAVRCSHPAERYVAPVKVREHDARVDLYDHVSLLLDLDRDYSTYFQFQVDQRGALAEDCWGDKTWNPRWFAAHSSTPTSWQVEAAIPIAELTGDPVTTGHAWACNLVRVVPGRGVQAWCLPAGVQPRPEGMGILMFMADPKTASKKQ
jgi:photosystem II stability/assembly factor-like uncharacterized protein